MADQLGTATEVLRHPQRGEVGGWQGDARCYRLDPPLQWTETDYHGDYDSEPETIINLAEYVVVSAAYVMISGPETYIFASDDKGEVTDWGELEGSYRGGLSHAIALRGAGYHIAPKAVEPNGTLAIEGGEG